MMNEDNFLHIDRSKLIAKGLYHGTAGPDNLPCAVKEVKAGEQQVLTDLHESGNHPWAKHIVKSFPQWKEKSKDQSLLPLAMEYCDHGDLESVLLQGYDGRHLTFEERKQMLHGIVKGLALVHSLGYVHRDLKPSNVLVGSHWTASKLAGSHGYMPPESGEGLQTAQFPQDVFSLGVLAYQLLAMREGALMLPHPFDSARTRGGTFNRALCLHDNIIRYQLASDWLDPISTQDVLAGNLIESMLQRDPRRRPTVHEVLAHPLFWTAADRAGHIFAFLSCGDKQLLGRMFSRLANQDPRLPPLMDPANPYLPLCIVTLQDFLDTDGKSSTFDSSPQVCTSACCQLFMSKHGDTDPGALQGCSQCMARLDHFCNEVSYHNVRILEDPSKASLKPTGNESWYLLQLKRQSSPDYEVFLNGGIGGPGNECTVNVYTIEPSVSGAEGDQLEFVVARCWVTLFGAHHESSSTSVGLPGYCHSELPGLCYPAEVLPADQQAFKIIPFRYSRKSPNREDPCPSYLQCFASLTSPLSTLDWARKCCADIFYHQPLQLCSGCATLKEHICTKHSHEGSVRLDLLKDEYPPGANAGIWNVYSGDRITYSLPQLDYSLAHVRFVFVMRNDPVGPPSTSKLRRVPLPTNPAQATCLFGPYCCFPIHCPMAHPVSLIKPKGLDSDACLSASLEDEVASAHPELCSDCSKLYAKAGHKDAVFDTCNSNSSHFCSGRNYHGFVVNFVSKDSSRIKTQYRIWHKREDEDPFDETKPRFNVYGLIKVEECGCQDLWQQKLQELKAKAVNVSKEEKQVLLAEICRECGKAGDHWIDVADRLFVGYDHLPGMLHLSTMYPDEKKSALESNKKKQKSAAEAGVRFGFEGRHQEFVIAVQQCDSKLGGPAKARLVALPYSIFGGDMCPEGHGCPDGPACPKIHSPAGNPTAFSTPTPPSATCALPKLTIADKLRIAQGRHAAAQVPAEVSPHDFPALSGTKTQSPSSSSSAWQFEDPGLDETSACKPAVEGHAQGLVDPYATHSGAKGRKKPQVKKMTLSDLIKIEEAKNSKRSVPNAWGPKPW